MVEFGPVRRPFKLIDMEKEKVRTVGILIIASAILLLLLRVFFKLIGGGMRAGGKKAEKRDY